MVLPDCWLRPDEAARILFGGDTPDSGSLEWITMNTGTFTIQSILKGIGLCPENVNQKESSAT
jgi:hypothetical protein